MKVFIQIVIAIVFSSSLFAQQGSGFNKAEGRDMIALCNTFTQIDILNTDKIIAPKGYHKYYTSGVYGLDNKFQIWKKEDKVVFVLRGSTAKKSSWLENMYSVMIPAKGSIIMPGMDTVTFVFSNIAQARVHAGWSLGACFVIEDIIHEIQLLNAQGVYDFVLTGHSQGGALVQLLRAYIYHLPDGVISNKCRFKVYAFASPMIGNKSFMDDYRNKFVLSKTSFNFYNPKDIVPTLPATVNPDSDKLYTIDNVEKLLDTTSSLTIKSFAFRAIANVLTKDPVESYIKYAGYSVHEQIVNVIGEFQMPEYSRDVKYETCSDRIQIGPFDDLEKQMDNGEEKDTLSIETQKYRDELKALRGGKMRQHKPYNYYLYYLMKYNPHEFHAILKKERELWNRP